MDRIRIGRDLTIKWPITSSTGNPVNLMGRNLSLELRNIYCEPIQLQLEVEGNVITTTFYGVDQTTLGTYTLTLWENFGHPGQNVADCVNAFHLVANTEQEDFSNPNSKIHIELKELGTGDMVIILPTTLGGGGADGSFIAGYIGGGGAENDFTDVIY